MCSPNYSVNSVRWVLNAHFNARDTHFQHMVHMCFFRPVRSSLHGYAHVSNLAFLSIFLSFLDAVRFIVCDRIKTTLHKPRLVFQRRSRKRSSHYYELNFVNIVSYSTKLFNAGLNLQVWVKLILQTSHGSWFKTCVTLWNPPFWASWAIGAWLGLWTRIWLRHRCYHCDARNRARHLPS